ncbi:MAG: hypothetical protein GY711_23025 [bacterium]|nr:hypothetical protein [bacterium]
MRHGTGLPAPSIWIDITLDPPAQAFGADVHGSLSDQGVELLFYSGSTLRATCAPTQDVSGTQFVGYTSYEPFDKVLLVAARSSPENGQVFLLDNIATVGTIGTRYCGPAVPNSTGQSAMITAVGSTSVADNTLMLMANNMPPNQFGYFLVSQSFGTVAPPSSSGVLCINPDIGRYACYVLNSGATGFFSFRIELTAIPRPSTGPHSVVPGETWNFQGWYRDAPTNNFTDAISITFN